MALYNYTDAHCFNKAHGRPDVTLVNDLLIFFHMNKSILLV